MKRFPFNVCTLGAMLLAWTGTFAAEPFEPTWDSLSQQQIPQWLKDAKFGVYTHWGVYSVPAHGGPDYIRNLYEGSKTDKKGVYSYHTQKYGSLKDFGYKDFIPKFTAPKFNADEWVGLMHEAGAKFGGICLVHHDGFLLWDSEISRWNSKNMGPKRDVYGEIAAAVRKYDDMKLLATFHHGRTFGYCTGSMKEDDITDQMRQDWDVFDPDYSDFYWSEFTGSPKEFSDQWKLKVNEVVDKYRPDLIWFDGLRTSMRNGHPPESYVLNVLANYFNRAGDNGQEVTVCNKHGGEFNFPESVGLRCFENGRDMPTDVGPWFLIDRAIAYPWSYVNNKTYRDGADYHVRSIVDVVSRGGIFLLSLTPKGDGSIPVEEQEIMRGIGRWLKVNGEAIYGTKPWTDLCRRAHGHSRHEEERQRRREGTMGLAKGFYCGRHPLHDQGRYTVCHRSVVAGGRQADRTITRQGGRLERRFGELTRARRTAHLESVSGWARGDPSGRTTMRLRFLLRITPK
jgi:alpha-L-fucosidase